jgi:hypothetical protein
MLVDMRIFICIHSAMPTSDHPIPASFERSDAQLPSSTRLIACQGAMSIGVPDPSDR